MYEGLCRASLWRREDRGFDAKNILDAWQVMARLGLPYRVCARLEGGDWECRIADSRRGDGVVVARGGSCGEAMCRAALQACAASDQAPAVTTASVMATR